MGIIVRQAFKATAVHYIGVVIGIFVSLFLQTKCLSSEAIGLTRVLYEIAYLLSLFALLGAGSVGMRFFPFFKDESTGHHGFFYYFRLMPLVGVTIFSLVFLLLRQPAEQYFSKESPLLCDFIYFVLPLFWVLTFWQFFESFANINMRIAVPRAVREVGMRLYQIAIFVAFYLKWIDITGLIVAYIVGYGLCLLSVGIYSSRIGCTEMRHDWSFITPDLRSKVVKYAAFMTIAGVSGSLLAQLDVFMVTGLKGLRSTGIYTIALYMAEVANMPSRSITPISSPIAAQAMKDGDSQKVNELFKQVSVHQMLTSAVILLFIWVNLDSIYAIIPTGPNGEDYSVGKMAVLLLGLSKVVYGVFNFGNVLISFSKYYYWTLIITILLTFFGVGTNLYFIPIYGLTGVALATLLTNVLSYGFQQVLVQWRLRCNPFSWGHLRVLVVVGILYGLNWLIPTLEVAENEVVSALADIAVRSGVLAIVGIALIYWFRISEQTNRIIENYIGKYWQ